MDEKNVNNNLENENNNNQDYNNTNQQPNNTENPYYNPYFQENTEGTNASQQNQGINQILASDTEAVSNGQVVSNESSNENTDNSVNLFDLEPTNQETADDTMVNNQILNNNNVSQSNFDMNYQTQEQNGYDMNYGAQDPNGYDMNYQAQNQNGYDMNYQAQNQNGYDMNYGAQNQNGYDMNYGAQNQNGYDMNYGAQNQNGYDMNYGAQNQNGYDMNYQVQDQNNMNANYQQVQEQTYQNQPQSSTSKKKKSKVLPIVLIILLLLIVGIVVVVVAVIPNMAKKGMNELGNNLQNLANEISTTPTTEDYEYYKFYNDLGFDYDSSKWGLNSSDNVLTSGTYKLSFIQALDNLSNIGYDINQASDRSSFYTFLYTQFSSQADISTTTVELGTSNFTLNNDSYYAYLDLVYGTSIERCYFVLLPNENMFVEFILSNEDTVIPDDMNEEVLDYISNIYKEGSSSELDNTNTIENQITNDVEVGNTVADNTVTNETTDTESNELNNNTTGIGSATTGGIVLSSPNM